MRNLVVVVALTLSACAADPVAPWLGEWDVDLSERVTPCGGGETTTHTGQVVWDIQENAAGPFIAGRCRTPLSISTDDFALFLPYTCDYISDGFMVEFEGLDGSMSRSGDRFTGTISAESHVDGTCYVVETTVSGLRRF